MYYIALAIALCSCIACLITKDLKVKRQCCYLREGTTAYAKTRSQIPENIKVSLLRKDMLEEY
ncbi:MAG: hypothetical protein RBS43_07200 [Candidatus Cloacimonas sp.]|jgi:hypothetical protein|nr:hypothetical protein [Candidatus Cloacimonas sp.]